MITKRNYVVVSAKWTKQQLIFWGSLTDDDQERSFGGYTDDIDACERYTLDDVRERFDEIPNLMAFIKNTEDSFYATEKQLVEMFGEPRRVMNL